MNRCQCFIFPARVNIHFFKFSFIRTLFIVRRLSVVSFSLYVSPTSTERSLLFVTFFIRENRGIKKSHSCQWIVGPGGEWEIFPIRFSIISDIRSQLLSVAVGKSETFTFCCCASHFEISETRKLWTLVLLVFSLNSRLWKIFNSSHPRHFRLIEFCARIRWFIIFPLSRLGN